MKQASAFFSGRKLLVATMHGKEKVLAPVFSDAFDMPVSVPDNFDTDRFGTFSGEVGRRLSPLDTARQKCRSAYEHTGIPLVLASEGSFGPHPAIGFIPADQEVLVLSDFEYGIEIKAQVTSTRTNFSGMAVADWPEAMSFAEKALFPSHALMIRPGKDDVTDIVKDISNWQSLQQLFTRFRVDYGRAFLETDMRAMHNPTRMTVIAETAQSLLEKMLCCCPSCGTPGFDVVKALPGLPCELCASPTRSIKTVVYGCMKCSCSKQEDFPGGRRFEDPTYCDFCNP